MLAFVVVAVTVAIMALALLVALFLDRRGLRLDREPSSASADATGEE